MKMQTVIDATCYEEHEKALFRAVVRQHGCWSDIWSRPEDFRDASAGVPGFIYYTDTEPFAKRNIANIIPCLNELEHDVGILDKDYENVMNWYAWFALEHIVDKVMTYKENQ